MNRIRIQKTSITELEVDAIVNAANPGLRAGGGVCGAIFWAAGRQELQDACDLIGYCNTGKAVITPGFKLKAKYIIHAVGPVWTGGDNGESQLLYSCYHESLRLAAENECHNIAFPLISSGTYGYPKRDAWRVALQACHDFIHENPESDLEIIFTVINDTALQLGNEMLHEVAPGDE